MGRRNRPGDNSFSGMSTLHRYLDLNGLKIFYREAGRRDAPVLLLPHGYPCSSFQYRRLLPALADRWRLIAPDYPGFGYSETPDTNDFDYGFGAYASFLEQFAGALGLTRYALYLHDYGSWIGLRLAMRAPARVAALIIQNGDIYQDAMGPKYAAIKRYWDDPSPTNHAVLEEAVSEHGFRDELIGETDERHAESMPPDLWKLHWPLMNTPVRRRICVQLMEAIEANVVDWFPRYQQYLREHRPPTLIVWGPRDGYMPEGSARAYLRDLPDAQLHLTDGGHWLLESHFETVLPLIRDFLGRVHAARN